MAEGYEFGTAGLASSAGKLSLYFDDEKIDEVCWGKGDCERIYPKFSNDSTANQSLVREEDGAFVQEKYYPEARFEQLEINAPIVEEACDGLLITEIFSYYSESNEEQFIEIYNSSSESIDIGQCGLRYKSKFYAFDDITLASHGYLALKPDSLVLTKDPSSELTIEIIGNTGAVVDSATYSHGQKKEMSFAKFDDGWFKTFAITPNSENIRQDFRTCEEGKVLNEETGNCIKDDEEEVTECKEGYERNPETNRCRKVQDDSSTLAECQEGYERNPETNRCRKITSTTDASEYPPTNSSAPQTSPSPKVFSAAAALIICVLLGIAYIVYQYRQEIVRFFKGIVSSINRRKLAQNSLK